jgi:radial spoke head protein 9
MRPWLTISVLCFQAGPDGPTLAEDVRGIWSLHWDAFSEVATVRCLLYPGYAFYYSHKALTWGGLYMGSGLKNNDLIFAL